jgi:hypothetical protein
MSDDERRELGRVLRCILGHLAAQRGCDVADLQHELRHGHADLPIDAAETAAVLPGVTADLQIALRSGDREVIQSLFYVRELADVLYRRARAQRRARARVSGGDPPRIVAA